MAHNMVSTAFLPIEAVLPHIGENKSMQTVDGIAVKSSSLRLQTFKHKGTDCVVCGCQGAYFSVERQRIAHRSLARVFVGSYHINLYGVMPNGTVRLMTHDHIIPKSNYGANTLENSVAMCEKCNCNKASKIPSAAFVAKHGCDVVPYTLKAPNVQIQTHHN